MYTKVRHKIYKILGFQLIMLILLAMVISFSWDLKSAYSTLLGGIAYLFPSVFLMAKLFFSKKNRNSATILIDFYSGELVKLLLSFVLLILLFKFIPSKIIFILIGYGTASLSYLFLPIVSCLKE